MQTTKERLTPATYKEIWAVVIGKETFFLNEIQVGVLKNAMVSGNRGAIWFEKFAISIPHVQCVYLVEKRQANVLTAGKEEKEMTEEEREKALKKLAEVRKELSQKLILDKKKK